jgi:hypothetical protein
VLRLIFCRLKQMRLHAVTSADGLGQAVLLENGLKHQKRIGFLGGGERLAGEPVAAGKVGDGEWTAIAPVGEHELALVIGAPQVIGLSGKGKYRSLALFLRPILRLTEAVAHPIGPEFMAPPTEAVVNA